MISAIYHIVAALFGAGLHIPKGAGKCVVGITLR